MEPFLQGALGKKGPTGQGVGWLERGQVPWDSTSLSRYQPALLWQ